MRKRPIQFTKMHGCGNDYIYINGLRERIRNPRPLAIQMSDRHSGVGSDGLILILPSRGADFRMQMFNADGSEGEMCGNGIRCVGKYVYDHGLTRKKQLSIETKGGLVSLRLLVTNGKVGEVEVNMGPPRPIPKSFYVKADGRQKFIRDTLRVRSRPFAVNVLSMGNPHCVIFVKNVERFPVEEMGPALEHHRNFPSRTNVEFVEIMDAGKVKQRTWERGSGETMACGSGACAVAATLVLSGKSKRQIQVQLKGGTLKLRYGMDGHVYMKGPATEICSGIW